MSVSNCKIVGYASDTLEDAISLVLGQKKAHAYYVDVTTLHIKSEAVHTTDQGFPCGLGSGIIAAIVLEWLEGAVYPPSPEYASNDHNFPKRYVKGWAVYKSESSASLFRVKPEWVEV